ncbi:MAG: hypothetical protein IT182_17920 [Acidobacteria bacterium]|nr:hypothetical protein [Acidobacteriota bacterium]
MEDFTDVAMAARRVAFDGDALVAAIRATFRRRQTPLPDGEILALTEEFTADERDSLWAVVAGLASARSRPIARAQHGLVEVNRIAWSHPAR